MTRIILTLALSAGIAYPQGLAQALVRDRVLQLPKDKVWTQIKSIALQRDDIINAFDERAGVVSLTLGLKAGEARKSVIEAAEMSDAAQMAHVLIWATANSSDKTRVFVRAAVGSEGIFLHSNGSLEREIFQAIESGQPWRSANPIRIALNGSIDDAWGRLLRNLSTSGFVINLEQEDAKLLTCSLPVSSDVIPGLVKEKLSGLHPAMAHFTLVLSDSGHGSELTVRSLLIETGRFAAPPLSSSGRIEEGFASMLRGEEVKALPPPALPIRTFWWTLFDGKTPSLDDSRLKGLRVELPESLDRVWAAALEVVVQFAVLIRCDRQSGVIDYLAVHPARGTQGFSFHHLAITMQTFDFGTNLYIYPGANSDSANDLALEKQVLGEKIATQLFIKERLSWLMGHND